MKYLKTLLVLIIFGSAFIACEDNEVSYAFQEISAPTNVTSVFEIAQDDSGLVTVTPSGEGAQEFNVYFGDVEDETPEVVTPGGSLDHVYAEGQFSVRVVGVGSTALTSEFTQVINVSFSAPENLEVTIDQSNPNPKLIKVSASADNATMFDVYFGDVEDEEPSQLMPDSEIEHIYEVSGDYTVRVVAKGASAETLEYTEDITIGDASGAMALPITFDDPAVNYAFGTFGGTTFEVVDNPDLSGVNAEASKVGAVTNSGVNWEGVAADLGTPVDFGGENKTITIKFWSDVTLPVLLKFEGGVDGERENEVTATHGGTGWELLSFNYATDAVKSFIDGDETNGQPFVPTGKYGTMVIFIDGPGESAGTFYLDDIEQEAADLNCVEETEENIDPANGDINWTFKTKDIAHSFEPFGNIASEIVDNPKATGINESCNVQSYIKTAGCETWSGVGKPLANAIDLTSAPNKAFKLMVYGESKTTTVTLQLEFEPFPNTDPLVAINQDMSKVGEWEELTFDFSAHSDKTFKSIIVYFDRDNACDDAVYYFDNLKQVAGDDNGGGTAGPTSFPIDFETPETGGSSKWDVFEADTPPLEVIANPDMSGANATATVAKFTAPFGGADYAGTVTQLSQKFTLDASNSTVSIMVWKSVISDVGIKFESNKASTGEIKIKNTKVNEWEEIVFDFSGKIGEPSSTDIDAIVVFPDFDARTQDNIVYFDNITLSSSSGGGSDEPTTAAPTPGQDQANVTSLFSDAYTDVTVDTWRTDWSSATLEDVTIDGSAMKKYSALDFVGIETVSSTVDASNMTHFRTDVWSADFTTFKVKLVDFGADGMFGGGDDSEHEITIDNPSQEEWVSLDIPMSEFTGLTARGHIAQYIFVGAPTGSNTVFVDNVYFYNDGTGGGTPATEPTTAAPAPGVAAANVISMFSDAYDDVTVDTWRTDWSSATLEDVAVDGNATKKYSALDFVGIETVTAQIDATLMTQFHLDVWSADFTEFKVKLVDFGADGGFGGGDDVEHEITITSPAQGEWVSLDLDLSDFTGLTTRANIAQIIFVGVPTGNNTVYVDNVYFHN
ncbi:hypothetical protein QWY87_06190 [Lutimonas halocynthiae]|uniref:hypothetical protein n=1 Tax=Lutimonas halocynthiae TaxID=1446477 RepID=UPI0025B478A1|nr:hypothetical protein [Lutimonas halocynthiae]MDN3642281.1 hypothetical protein [Lutimonas halocynthiae]